MMLKPKDLIPDYKFDTVFDVIPDELIKRGIKAILLDIDNTLVTYDDPIPTEKAGKWIGAVTKAGIKIAFISNNEEERVALFNKNLGFPYKSKAGKPKIKYAKELIQKMGADEKSTVSIGDQIFTDVLLGKRLGIMTVMVDPIKDKQTAFFKMKRYFEKIIMKKHGHLAKTEW